jgi:hypothetical protein
VAFFILGEAAGIEPAGRGVSRGFERHCSEPANDNAHAGALAWKHARIPPLHQTFKIANTPINYPPTSTILIF